MDKIKRILGLSAYDDEQYISNLLSSGAAGYLTKEQTLNKIVQACMGWPKRVL